MRAMEVITLDDTNDSSLFVYDESPIMEEVTNVPSRRKRKLKQGKQKKNAYVILGGKISDDSFVSSSPKPKKKKKKSDIETIVIDDDNDDDSVIELSDDERVGVTGGLLSGSMEGIQRKIQNFQKLREKRGRLNAKKRRQAEAKFEELKKASNTETNGASSAKKKDKEVPPKPRKLRPVVIDGSNVAFGHSGHGVFSSRGIEICYEYFKKRGHTVKVFIPQFRRRHPATKDTHILDKLEKEKVLVFTPSRMVQGKLLVSYDDRMMLDYATQTGAVVVTRDCLKDLISENESFKDVINNRLLMFTWVDEEVILFPQDPLGRTGPKLDDFLSFPEEEKSEDKEETKESKGDT